MARCCVVWVGQWTFLSEGELQSATAGHWLRAHYTTTTTSTTTTTTSYCALPLLTFLQAFPHSFYPPPTVIKISALVGKYSFLLLTCSSCSCCCSCSCSSCFSSFTFSTFRSLYLFFCFYFTAHSSFNFSYYCYHSSSSLPFSYSLSYHLFILFLLC